MDQKPTSYQEAKRQGWRATWRYLAEEQKKANTAQAAKQREAAAKKQARQAVKLAAKDEKLARKHGLTVEEIRLGRAVEATRKRRGGFGIGIGI
jgi:FKBP-type peptidyl-prolyl cis-trans isomerase (trigger factor)